MLRADVFPGQGGDQGRHAVRVNTTGDASDLQLGGDRRGLEAQPRTFTHEDGMDFAAATVQLPDGERVSRFFSMKGLVAKGEGNAVKPGFT